jgi:hypothetical protein
MRIAGDSVPSLGVVEHVIDNQPVGRALALHEQFPVRCRDRGVGGQDRHGPCRASLHERYITFFANLIELRFSRIHSHLLKDTLEGLTNLFSTGESLKLISHKGAIISERPSPCRRPSC